MTQPIQLREATELPIISFVKQLTAAGLRPSPRIIVNIDNDVSEEGEGPVMWPKRKTKHRTGQGWLRRADNTLFAHSREAHRVRAELGVIADRYNA